MAAVRTANKSFCFYFDADDKALLEYASEKVDLTQSDIMRRLIRAYAAGLDVPGMPTCPANAKAVKWIERFTK